MYNVSTGLKANSSALRRAIHKEIQTGELREVVSSLFGVCSVIAIAGSFTNPVLDFTEFRVAPLIGASPEIAWALTVTAVVLGFLTLAAVIDSK